MYFKNISTYSGWQLRAVHNLISFWLYLFIQSLRWWVVHRFPPVSWVQSSGPCYAPQCASSPLVAAWGSFRICLELVPVQPEIVQQVMLHGKTLAQGATGAGGAMLSLFFPGGQHGHSMWPYGIQHPGSQNSSQLASAALCRLFPLPWFFPLASHLFLLRCHHPQINSWHLSLCLRLWCFGDCCLCSVI